MWNNVKIKQGVKIGDGAVLATECFVTKDVKVFYTGQEQVININFD